MKRWKKALSLILSVTMLMTMAPSTIFAASSGTTSGQPFSSGTGGSQNFRIPAMATTSSGEIIAATDARYTGTGDGYGLDTMVSYSMDKGSTWNYSYVNYNDDSSGYNNSASAFIDPALAIDGSTVYLFAGLYPGGGVYIGNGKSGTGYTTVNSESVLALYDSTSATSSTTPSYYVSNTKNSGGYYPIYKYSDSSETSYYVDGEYDIYTLSDGSYTAVTGTQIDSSTKINANIFYTGTANTTGMYVLGTYYLTMRKGTINSKGSITWGSLSILNSQVKDSSESFYGIGPAGAIVTSTGRIVLPMYTYAGFDGNASVIYSDDNGSTWTRGKSVSEQTSEASVSEVNVNGTKYLYMFTRHGGYYVSSDMGATWSSKKSVSGISYYTGCQLSTLTYSKTIDGYPAILLSVPSNTSGRTNGKIFVGLVQTDGTINWKYNYQVNNSTYQYSDLIELSDGSIGILYENGSASEKYETLAISAIASGATIGTAAVTYTASVSSNSVTEDGTITLSATASDSSDTSAVTWASSDSSVLSVSGTTATAVKAGTATLTATLPDGSTQTFAITVNAKDEESGSDSGSDSGTSAATDRTVNETTTEVAGGTVYQLDTDGVDAGSEYVIYSYYGSANRILYNVSGSSTTDQCTPDAISDYNFTAATTITPTTTYDVSRQLWTVEASGSGYKLKGNSSGTYLDLTSTTSTNSNVSSSGTVVSITTSGTGNIVSKLTSGSSGTNYLVHGSGSSTKYYTSSSSTGDLLYFFKKTTTSAGTTTTYTADNSTLATLIAQASALSSSDYTEESFDALTIAFTAAKAIATPTAYDNKNDAQTEQDAINTAAKNLSDAIAGLVKQNTITVTVGESVTESVTGTLDSTDLDPSIATVNLNAGTLTVIGVAAGKTYVTIGGTKYKIVVKEKSTYVDMDSTPFTSGTTLGASGKVTKLTTSVGLSYDINIDTSIAASGGTWSIADTTIATVDSNGTVTGVAAGETTLTYTVGDVTYTMPVVIRADATGSSVKTYEFYVSEVTSTTTYMSVSCSTDLVEVIEGEAIYISTNKSDDTSVDFFGAPYKGYALSRMSSTNSAGNYQALDGTNPTEMKFYTTSGTAGAYQVSYFGGTVVAAMLNVAKGYGCDGGMGWTRESSNTANVTSTLTFRSEKLPTVKKSVKSVGGTTYTEGMNAKSGDKIVFTITVTKYACEDSITYSDASLTDNLSGAVFSGTSSATKSITISSGTSAETQTFDVEYTVKDSDLDTVITNTVDLEYTYKATYSSGSFGSTANAEAKVNALSFTPKDIVVDFGLPVTIDYSASDAHGRYDLSSDGAKATYGTVTVVDNKVTYTPNKVLQDTDTVTITNAKGTEYTFKVYPASTVYYEATSDFITYTGSWTKSGSISSASQNKAVIGSDANNYGFDTAYDGTNDYAKAVSKTNGDTAAFSFTGTGVDLNAICTKESGKVIVIVKDSAGKMMALKSIDTASINGNSTYTTYPEGDLYNVPIMSLSGLSYGTYTVTVTKSATTEVTLDGFKVYNTLADSSVYKDDLEDNPTFIEVRDLNFATVSLTKDSTKYASNIYEQVHSSVSDSQSITAVITSAADNEVSATADLIDNGPKNEVYLYPGMTLTLNINTDREVQIGLRGLQESLTCELGTTEQTVSTTVSTTDMFYTVKAKGSTKTVTITNPSTNTNNTETGMILAVTKLKVCDAPDAVCEITEENIEDTLAVIDGTATEEPEEPVVEYADATCSINLTDYTGAVLASTSLTANGVAGEDAVFAAADIQAAAESVLPSGYAFADASAIADATVAYGEDGTVNVQIGKVATLKITYKKGFRTVGTATLTHVQTSSSKKYTFSTSEIKAAAPSGCRVISLMGTSVNYGATKSITAIGM